LGGEHFPSDESLILFSIIMRRVVRVQWLRVV
jgi:hypothetical protein